MTNSHTARSGPTPRIRELSNRLTALEKSISDLSDRPVAPQAMSIDIVRVRRSLMQARNAIRRLGHGSMALAGFTLVAFLAALFEGKLSLLSGFITVTAALFLALVGYIFHMQADSIDLGDTNDQ